MIDAIARTLTRLASVAKIICGRWIRALATGLAGEYDRIVAYRDAVYYAAIPSDRLGDDAIDDLERKYGIAVYADATIEERRARVVERASLFGSMGPGWLQEQIQKAGFPLYVVENTPAIDTRIKNPDMYLEASAMPDFPDNVAGRVYWNDDFTTTDSWGGINGTVSVSGGALIGTATGTPSGLYRDVSGSAGNIIRVRIKASVSVLLQFQLRISGVDTLVKTQTVAANTYTYIDIPATSAFTRFIVFHGTSGITMSVDTIYIGSGLYDTKVPDITGKVVVTDYGALPVVTDSGRKALSFNGAQYLQADRPVIGTTGTIAVKFKRNAISGTLERIFFNRNSVGLKGIAVSLSLDNTIQLTMSSDTSSCIINGGVVSDITMWHTIVFIWSGSQVFSSLDGAPLIVQTQSVQVLQSTTPLYIGRHNSAADFFNGLLADPVYDSRLWTQADVDWYDTHDGVWPLSGDTMFGDVQFDDTTQFGTMPSRVDPSTVDGVLITSSANKPGGRRAAENAQFGVGMQFGGGSQFGSPDPSYAYPLPAERVYPTDPVYWGCVFFLSPVQGRLATADELLYLSSDQVAYLTRLVIQLKPVKRWCVAQVATRVVIVDALDDAILTFEDGEIWTA